jgi:hypothetical protein
MAFDDPKILDRGCVHEEHQSKNDAQHPQSKPCFFWHFCLLIGIASNPIFISHPHTFIQSVQENIPHDCTNENSPESVTHKSLEMILCCV